MSTDAYIDDFSRFIAACPSSYHAAAEVARRLVEAGFTPLDERAAWDDTSPEASAAPTSAGSSHGRNAQRPAHKAFVVRDGAIIAWVRPAGATARTPFRILGSHTDSPGFKLKPKPTTAVRGWLQAGVEVYGGPLLNSWLDRELELAGRLVDREGVEHLVRTGPWLRIPQLAIHLDRTANEGLTLDRQRHTQPIFGVGTNGDVVGHLAELAGLGGEDVAGYDVLTVDTAAPARFGQDGALFAAGRLDNLSSVYAGLVALLASVDTGTDPAAAAEPSSASAGTGTGTGAGHISVLAAFDHEEIGSESRSGASGPFLADVLTRISGGSDSERLEAYAGSWCISADAGHAVHPNYPERHDPANQPILGGGALLKINANQRYATDAHGAALWSRLSRESGAGVQEFVSNNTVPCGSTIGPLTATRLGIRTVDVGIPLLSMHSAREMCHVEDAAGFARTIEAFFSGS